MDYKQSAFLEIETQIVDIQSRETSDGVIYLKSSIDVQPHPFRITERLSHFAAHQPNTVFLGQRNEVGEWETIRYGAAYHKVRRIGQWLLDNGASADRPIAILTGNSIEHGLMALAALHIGVPYSAITPAYATNVSGAYGKLKHTLDLLTPSIIMVSDGRLYEKALQEVEHGAVVVYIKNASNISAPCFSYDAVCATEATEAVEEAFDSIRPETVAKVLFTSGSTGLPKGVINTHLNITTNLQQMIQTFPLMKQGFELIDWLPWSHTFGGNQNFGLTISQGGSLYIDDGNPTSEGILRTVANLKERNPTIYYNVPKGFEMLIPYLKEDAQLRKRFFKRLQFFFYAGAGMAQHVWDALEALAFETTGKRLMIVTGLGCTESSPAALFNVQIGSFAGLLGTPISGLELKLVPNLGKLEARYKGDNIMPGYWRNPEATAKAFDEEGFYMTGDALKFVDTADPNQGMVFDGRVAEDFKLDTGTWVSVGTLRAKFIESGKGFIQDVVITGHDRPFVGAIVFPDLGYLKAQLGIEVHSPEAISVNSVVAAHLHEIVEAFKGLSSGSASRIHRAVIAPFSLSSELGEITDKGSINQRAVLGNRVDVVEMIYHNV